MHKPIIPLSIRAINFINKTFFKRIKSDYEIFSNFLPNGIKVIKLEKHIPTFFYTNIFHFVI